MPSAVERLPPAPSPNCRFKRYNARMDKPTTPQIATPGQASASEQANGSQQPTAPSTSDQLARINRSAYRWNTAAGLLSAFQSVILLIVITRVCDVYTAGVFTIAYANGNLFLNMGKYGMRQFQVSDRTNQFSFREYRASRIATTAAMICCATAFLAYNALTLDYSTDKIAAIFIVALYEAVGAFEDVYLGNYQQCDRLDVGARLLTIRLVTTIALFAGAIAITKSLPIAAAIATVFAACFVVGEVAFAKRRYQLPPAMGELRRRRVGKLLKECFPLFAAAFLLFYIGNAPKYAIDALMDDAAQAYYGYIAMPVFIVSLLATFIYNPMIASLAEQWRNREVRAFVKRFAKLACAIAGLTIACDLAAWLLGIPVLDLLYNADLAPYLGELLVLVTGGGFLALAALATLGITIVRFQRVLAPIYLVATIAAWALSNWAVAGWGITGASWAYFTSMLTLAILFVIAFVAGIRIQAMSNET